MLLDRQCRLATPRSPRLQLALEGELKMMLMVNRVTVVIMTMVVMRNMVGMVVSMTRRRMTNKRTIDADADGAEFMITILIIINRQKEFSVICSPQFAA